jgi:flavin-dependent dehydrogenase
MPTKEHAAPFREDPAGALVDFVAAVPDAPPIRASRLIGPAQGKLDMTNVAHVPTAPGLALVGDAALAIDPLWGVGCGWALQSAEWLVDSVAPALLGGEPLTAGLKRYRRRHTRALRGHAMMIYDYAGGRRLNPGERLLFSTATYDQGVAAVMEAFGTRNIGPARMLATAVPRALVARLSHRRRATATPASSATAGTTAS